LQKVGENQFERQTEMKKLKNSPEFSFLISVVIFWSFSVITPLINPGTLHIFVAINVFVLINFCVIFYFWHTTPRTTTLLRFAFFVMDRKSVELLRLDEDYKKGFDLAPVRSARVVCAVLSASAIVCWILFSHDIH
jgi:hypothetical protein